MLDDINNIYEYSRNILIQTENVTDMIQDLKNKTLKLVLSELLKACQADLLILLNCIYEAENCLTDLEINALADAFSIPKQAGAN